MALPLPVKPRVSNPDSKRINLARIVTPKAIYNVLASSHSVERMESRNCGLSAVMSAVSAVILDRGAFSRTDEIMINIPSVDMSVVIGFGSLQRDTCEIVTVINKGHAMPNTPKTQRAFVTPNGIYWAAA